MFLDIRHDHDRRLVMGDPAPKLDAELCPVEAPHERTSRRGDHRHNHHQSIVVLGRHDVRICCRVDRTVDVELAAHIDRCIQPRDGSRGTDRRLWIGRVNECMSDALAEATFNRDDLGPGVVWTGRDPIVRLRAAAWRDRSDNRSTGSTNNGRQTMSESRTETSHISKCRELTELRDRRLVTGVLQRGRHECPRRRTDDRCCGMSGPTRHTLELFESRMNERTACWSAGPQDQANRHTSSAIHDAHATAGAEARRRV